MAYEPTTWAAGDVVTSAKLNKLENGVAGAGIFFISSSYEGDNYKLDKTWQEIKTAVDAGLLAVIREINEGEGEGSYTYYVVNGIGYYAGSEILPASYEISYVTGADTYQFVASSSDGYPVLNDNEDNNG